MTNLKNELKTIINRTQTDRNINNLQDELVSLWNALNRLPENIMIPNIHEHFDYMSSMEIPTGNGILIARPSNDLEHPGLYIAWKPDEQTEGTDLYFIEIPHGSSFIDIHENVNASQGETNFTKTRYIETGKLNNNFNNQKNNERNIS